MNLLDGLIIVAAVAYGVGGFRNGAVVGIFSTIGFFGGAAVGAQLAKPIGSAIASGRVQIPVAIVCVLFFAMLGQLLGVWVAGHIKARVLIHEKSRAFDSGVGSGLGVLSVLLVAWMIAVPLRFSPYPQLSSEAVHSKIVRAVDGVMPDGVRNLYSSLRSFLDQSGFPPVFGDLNSTPIVSVAAPPNLSPQWRHQALAAEGRTFKIYGEAPSCDRRIEGSGFVFAREHIITNAHVVAGTDHVTVEVPGRRRPVAATVTLFDKDTDIAVLYVPGLSVRPLPMADPGKTAGKGDPALVLGYPKDGPFTIRTARVRSVIQVNGNDIYGTGRVRREIYAVRSTIRSGNSGGPMLDENGRVLGVVFATALDSSDTGFVLTNAAIAPDVRQGASATNAVSTQSCTPG